MPTSVLLLAALTSPARALSVFILDDSDSNTDNLVAELEGWGHTVTLSTTDYGFSETAFSSSSGVSLTDYDAVIWLSGGGLLGTDFARLEYSGARLDFSPALARIFPELRVGTH